MEERQGPQNVLGVAIEKPLGHLSEPLGITIFFYGGSLEGKEKQKVTAYPESRNLRNLAHVDSAPL